MASIGGNCWLIADPGEPMAQLMVQFAQLRGLQVHFCPSDDESRATIPASFGNVVGVNAESFALLGASRKEQLKSLVRAGTTLYIRGLKPGSAYSLQPFADGAINVSAERPARGYRCTNDPIVPSALRDETATCAAQFLGANRLCFPARPLLLAVYPNGEEIPVISAIKCGAGNVIFDLLPCPPITHDPILRRLSDPCKRYLDVGPLIAVDAAAGRDAESRSAFNLVIDDRPANYDYFTAPRLEQFLQHIETLCPGVHIDFGWTPNQTHLSRRYISILKSFNTGFVWHGFLRHVDHNKIDHLDNEVAIGQSLVRSLSGRYGVVFQKVMIFPYEHTSDALVARLALEGFIASVEHADARPECDNVLPGHLQYSTPAFYLGPGYVPILRRYSSEMLAASGMMLALATLGYPIIAAAHPRDVLLRRFRQLNPRSGSFSHFDHVLAFAADKKLRAASLEEIALLVEELHGEKGIDRPRSLWIGRPSACDGYDGETTSHDSVGN